MKFLKIDERYVNTQHIVSISPDYVTGTKELKRYIIKLSDGDSFPMNKSQLSEVIKFIVV